MTNKTMRLFAILLLSIPGHLALAADYKTEGRNCFQGAVANPCPALTGDAEYVKENFAFNLSAGVEMKTAENASAIGVNTAHDDGLFTYGGSSEGGAVRKCGTKRTDFTTKLALATPTATDGCGGGTDAAAAAPTN